MPKATVGTSATTLGSSSVAILYGVQIKADDDNTDSLYLKFSSATTITAANADMRLKAGQGYYVTRADALTLGDIQIIGGAAAQVVWSKNVGVAGS